MSEPAAADAAEVIRRFADLVALVSERPTAAAEQRALVKDVVKAAKESAATIRRDADGRLMSGDQVLDIPLLAGRMKGYGIEELGITAKAAVADLLDLARMLAATPNKESAAGFAGRIAVLDARALPLKLVPRDPSQEPPSAPVPPPRPSRRQTPRASKGMTPAATRGVTPAPGTPRVTPEATERISAPVLPALEPEHEHDSGPSLELGLPVPSPANPALAAAVTALAAAEAGGAGAPALIQALEHLSLLADLAFRQGRHDDLIEGMAALVAIEHQALQREASDERRQAFSHALKRLTMRPMLVRQLAVLRHVRADDEVARTRLQAVLRRYGIYGADALADEFMAAPTPEARATCLAALRELKHTHDSLLGLSRSTSLLQVQEAAALLGELRDSRSERILVEMLRHPEPRARRSAVASLGRFTTASSLDAIALLLDDPSPRVRLGAVAAIGQRRDAKVVDLLKPLLDKEADTEVLFSAVGAVGAVGTPEGVQLLITIAQGEGEHPMHRSAALRVLACTALVTVRSPTAMAAVQLLRDDRDEKVREASIRLVAQAKRRSTASHTVVTGT
jgi:HEAT repeat protein